MPQVRFSIGILLVLILRRACLSRRTGWVGLAIRMLVQPEGRNRLRRILAASGWRHVAGCRQDHSEWENCRVRIPAPA